MDSFLRVSIINESDVNINNCYINDNQGQGIVIQAGNEVSSNVLIDNCYINRAIKT